MSTALATKSDLAEAIERVVVSGDLSQLKAEERLDYYRRVCESLGLNPLTSPFAYITLNNKLKLYALREATDQLRKIHGVSVTGSTDTTVNEVYVVTCHVKDQAGRTDVSKGAVSLKGLGGEALANAIMKAETKAKRRATLSICGLGMLDETEVEDIKDARYAPPPSVGQSPKAPAKSAPAITTGASASPPSEPQQMIELPADEGPHISDENLKRVQAAVSKLDLGKSGADIQGLRGEARNAFIRTARLSYLSWCLGRPVTSTLALTDDEAVKVVKMAGNGEMPND
jgi:hypothetical protein